MPDSSNFSSERLHFLSNCAIMNSQSAKLPVEENANMKLTPPKNITFWICVVLGVLGLLAFTGTLKLLPVDPFWLEFVGLALLAVALLVKGL